MNQPIVFSPVLILRRKYIRAFKRAGAISSRQGIVPGEHGVRNGLVFSRLVSEGSLKPVGDGRYFLDEETEIAVRAKRRKIVLMVLVVMLVSMAIVFGVLK